MSTLAWVDGALRRRRRRPRVSVARPRVHRRRRRLRDDEGRRRRAVRADPPPATGSRASAARPAACPRPTTTWSATRVAAVAAQPARRRLGRLRITYGGGVAPARLRPRRRAPPPGRRRRRTRPPWPRRRTAVVTVPWTRNERSAVAGLKTTSYAENVVAARARARSAGASEALFANTRGELCEGTGSQRVRRPRRRAAAPRRWPPAASPASPARWSLEWCDATGGDVDPDGRPGPRPTRCS